MSSENFHDLPGVIGVYYHSVPGNSVNLSTGKPNTSFAIQPNSGWKEKLPMVEGVGADGNVAKEDAMRRAREVLRDHGLL